MYDKQTKGKMGNEISEKDESSNNSKKQSKGGRKGSKKTKGKRYGSKDINRGVKFNDIGFYTKNKSISDAFAKLPFSYIIGGALTGITSNPDYYPITTIVSFIVDWLQSVRNTVSDGRDILDQVATILYTRMRRANSGATNNIEYVDPIISNLVASIDILVNSVSMKRVFRIANSFSWKNRLLPKEIFLELGIDYDDFIANQALYRGKFNTLVALARTIRTLKDYPFINAICAEFENIFKDEDADTGREQLFLPIKGFHHIYDPVGTQEHPGGMIRLLTFSDIGKTATSVQSSAPICTAPLKNDVDMIRKFSLDLKILETQIYALINDNDFNLIQADIEKAFGEQSGYMVMDVVEENPTVLTPIFSGEFALMFQNGRFYPTNNLDKVEYEDSVDGKFYCIQNKSYVNVMYQDHDSSGTTKLRSWFHFKGASAYIDYRVSDNGFINSNSHDPSTDDVIISTRYQTLMGSGPVTDAPTDFRFSGTLGTGEQIYYPKVSSNFFCFGGRIRTLVYLRGSVSQKQVITWHNAGPIGNDQEALRVVSYFMQCGFAPMWLRPIGGNPTRPIGLTGKINNIRFVTQNELEPIHEAVFLSLWNLPEYSNI